MPKVLAVAVMFCGFAFLAPAANAQQAASTPDYCVDFSYDACQRIRAVVEAKIRPAYCVPGYGTVDSGLTPEQIRICSAMPLPQSPEERRSEAAFDANRNQQIEDARAMVRELWESDGHTIETIEIGYKCGVVDLLSANVAVRGVQVDMEDQLANAGLAGDSTMSIEKVTVSSVQFGKSAVEAGACTRLTPAMRGELRSMVAAFTQ